MAHMTDNMNDFQHTELNSIKSRNQGGGGWTLSEFGHRMVGEVAFIRCVRLNLASKEKHILEYEVDTRGISRQVRDDRGPAV